MVFIAMICLKIAFFEVCLYTFIMRFLRVLLLLLLSVFFMSCASQMNQENSDSATLRVIATTLDENTDWSNSMEGSILEEDYSKDGMVKFELTPMAFAVTEDGGNEIYPHIDGAFSLDVTGYEKECYEAVENFFRAFRDGEKLEEHFKSSNLYSLVMFLYDYGEKFGEKKISWYAIGEPFINENYCQCPVRLFFAGKKSDEKKSYRDSHADVIVFVSREDSGWKLISMEFAGSKKDDSEQ